MLRFGRDEQTLERYAHDAAYLAQPPVTAESVRAVAEDEAAAGEVSTAEALRRLVLGSRTLRHQLDELEREAARQARDQGVTVRALAADTGMSERAASARYRRSEIQ